MRTIKQVEKGGNFPLVGYNFVRYGAHNCLGGERWQLTIGKVQFCNVWCVQLPRLGDVATYHWKGSGIKVK